MTIVLDYKIDIDVVAGESSKDQFSVFYREPTVEEKRANADLEKRFRDIFKRAKKIERKRESLSKKAELHELNGDFEKSISAIEKRDSLEDDIEAIESELEEIGGGDQDAFAEESARKRFELLVSGSDKAKLAGYAEIKGYVKIMSYLDKAKASLEKKQSGE
jgi:G3E family GTPase